MGLTSREKIEAVVNEVIESTNLGIDQNRAPVFTIKTTDNSNPETNNVLNRRTRRFVTKIAKKLGVTLTSKDIKEVCEMLSDQAEASEQTFITHTRIAETEKGLEIDIGDDTNDRILLHDGIVDIVSSGSDTLFIRPNPMLPFIRPADTGDVKVLHKYLNMDEVHAWLLTIWLCFILTTPRSDTASFPILVLIAGQGSSKSTICKLIIRSLLDPSLMGIQGFPNDRKDMVLAAAQALVLIYDNLRYLSNKWSDILCISSTGGNDPTRKLYTDSDIVNHRFQVPLVLNGIHDFIAEPDLAQRCLRLELHQIPESKRLDPKEFADAFNADLPVIFMGLLDLAAKILQKLPEVTVTHPQRMIGFVKYLAAAEEILVLEASYLQSAYADILDQSQQDIVLEDPLASAVLDMMSKKDRWAGTPSKLLEEIKEQFSMYDPILRQLPSNPIALSKRLKSLSTPLFSQGLEVIFSRGKERRIEIINLEAF